MGPFTAVTTVAAKTFTFKGRASRSEYWWFYLFCSLVFMVCTFIDMAKIVADIERYGEVAVKSLSALDLVTLYAMIVLAVPFISVTVRRLHDAGFSGFWSLLHLIPLGGLALPVMHMLPSKPESSVHGTPASGPATDRTGRPMTVDQHKRAMQGYALLFDKDKQVTPEMQAARKAEISDYYRTRVLKPAAGA